MNVCYAEQQKNIIKLLVTDDNIICHVILQVVVSVMCYRSLRQPPNLLLLALAVTDLFVSLVVMPGMIQGVPLSSLQLLWPFFTIVTSIRPEK